MIKVFWLGLNSETKRVWGYFVDTNIHSADFGNIKTVQTFWGSLNGHFYFQTKANTNEFQRTNKKKVKKYKYTKEIESKLISEYEKHILVRKLKGNYA